MVIERIIEPRKRPVGSGEVDRVLPVRERRNVGPFVFADIIGPDEMPSGVGADIATHPHIGLATVTYLFDGAIVHRDSTGAVQRIEPGAVNWMTAGRGVVHSERTPDDVRAATSRMAGLQTWVALPEDSEETDAAFEHAGADEVPEFGDGSVRGRVVAGEAFGVRSPIGGSSPLFHIDVQLDEGAVLAIPHALGELAVLAIAGDVRVDDTPLSRHHAAVAASRSDLVVRAESAARIIAIGGDPVGPRFIWWNFVSSSRERIEQAKADWMARRFAPVPGDDERIELP